MKASIRWLDDVAFVAESGSGHSIVIDGAPEHGGRNLGIRPMEAVLIGVGACSAFDVVTILKKSRQRVTACSLELDAERADAVPSPFTRIVLTYVVTGQHLDERRVARAVSLSVDTYCSASAMLRAAGVEIVHGFEIREAERE